MPRGGPEDTRNALTTANQTAKLIEVVGKAVTGQAKTKEVLELVARQVGAVEPNAVKVKAVLDRVQRMLDLAKDGNVRALLAEQADRAMTLVQQGMDPSGARLLEADRTLHELEQRARGLGDDAATRSPQQLARDQQRRARDPNVRRKY